MKHLRTVSKRNRLRIFPDVEKIFFKPKGKSKIRHKQKPGRKLELPKRLIALNMIRHFNISFDQVATHHLVFYDKVLTPEQIKAIHLGGKFIK